MTLWRNASLTHTGLRRCTPLRTYVKASLCILIMCLAATAAAVAQLLDAPEQQKGIILGTTADMNGTPIPKATLILEDVASSDHRIVVADDSGFFELNSLEPGTLYHLTISAKGFANWTSPAIILKPGECRILTDIKLQVAAVLTTVNVRYSSEEIATEQIKIEEQQRVLGIIPNFYVVYDHNAEPLTTKLKFKLALRTSFDPITIIGIGAFAGIQQAADIPNYRQGWEGYGQRLGAGAADGFANIMVGGAILPSLLHQDPRYFYQGRGTKKSRALHALSNPFICKGDNGQLQPNYSSIGGDLATAALANAYYPSSNRGAGLVFEDLLISTGERMLSSLVQEFILSKFTSKTRSSRNSNKVDE